MKEDTRELLGIGRDDYWYYLGIAVGVASFWVSRPLAFTALLLLSTGLVLVFLVKSTPRYLESKELSQGTRVFGLIGNAGLVILQTALIGFRLWRWVTQ